MENRFEKIQKFKEPQVHGTKDFPFKIYESEDYHKGGIDLYAHLHEELEIIIINQGELNLTIDNYSFSAKKNTIILLPPFAIHSAYSKKEDDCRYTSIVFHLDFIASRNQDKIQKEYLRDFAQETMISYYVLDRFNENNLNAKSIVNDLKSFYKKDIPYRELMIKGCLLLLLPYLLTNENTYKKRIVDNFTIKRKQTIIRFIENNFAEPLTLEDMAEVLSLSKEQFCRFFKKSFQTTPINYLNRYRVFQAIKLMEEGNLSITEIGVKVGFNSSSYFSIIFRKITEKSPREFKLFYSNDI